MKRRSTEETQDTAEETESQGYLLLQESSQSSESVRTAAASAIRRASVGGRLSGLAMMVANGRGSHFTEVMAAIDKMVGTLKAEEADDLEKKETCESDRADNTRTAALKSREMDELTDGITKLQSEIEQIKAEIVEKEETIKQTEEQLADATENRKKENEEWTTSDADDKLAKETTNRAKDVLTDFYADNNLMLVQKSKVGHKQPAGEAPPPPPPTWEAPYGGKTGESTSIIAILEMIADDIEKDIQKAKADEDKAQKEFDDFKSESETQIDELTNDISELNGSKGDKENSISEKTEDRTTASGELNAVMKTINDERPGCDFFEVNYPNRLKNRQIEIDGLVKAKAILQGAEFSSGAFLQKRK